MVGGDVLEMIGAMDAGVGEDVRAKSFASVALRGRLILACSVAFTGGCEVA